MDDIAKCPLRNCPGEPEIMMTDAVNGKERWTVRCSECRGWMIQYDVGKDEDGYLRGIEVWEEMKKELGSRE